ncbi:MAG: LLM class F420-dependent oxidoreductase [Dehalococcoidia bacterium]|nr:LLM class F420-dependent oxidoreductase [Dehalococcoidia bacterium]
MRVGLQLPNFTWPGGPGKLAPTLAEIARTADAAGFASLWVMDHFFQIPGMGPAESDMLDSWTTLGFLSGVTQRVKLGTMITGVTYRHPGLLAKMATTLDVLSGGRSYLGIGAAWYEREHKGLGVTFPPRKERFQRLEETLQIVHQMWSGNRGPYEGRYYQLAETMNVPLPLTRPHPPIMVGGGGEQKTLRLAARYGDAVNVFGDPATVKHKYEVLQHWCEVEGRPYEAMERTTLQTARLDPQDGASVESIIERFGAYAQAGVQHIIVNMPNVAYIAPLERFGEHIIPAVASF